MLCGIRYRVNAVSRFRCELCNCMELSPSREGASYASTEELPSILWNPKVHHLVPESPWLVTIFSQISPVYTVSHPRRRHCSGTDQFKKELCLLVSPVVLVSGLKDSFSILFALECKSFLVSFVFMFCVVKLRICMRNEAIFMATK
jgi:hypothetical protein